MAFNPCLKSILCALGQATLDALNTVLQAQLVVIDAQIAAFTAQLAILDILTLPLSAAAVVAQEAINAANQVVSLVPLGLISDCADLGDLNVNLTQVLDNANADFQDIVTDLNRKLSFKDEINAGLEQLAEVRQQFSDILLTIEECST